MTTFIIILVWGYLGAILGASLGIDETFPRTKVVRFLLGPGIWVFLFGCFIYKAIGKLDEFCTKKGW